MRRPSRGLMLVLMAGGLAACSSVAPPAATPRLEPPPRYRVTLARSTLNADQQIVHVLGRLGYGARPGEVERVRAEGLSAWIERQLEPGRISDEAVEPALGAYPVLPLTAAELYRDYPPARPQDVQRFQAGQMTPQEIRGVFPPNRRPAVITAQLQAAKLTRAVLSERQLEEVMVDFWFNHFNVYALKGPVRWMVPDYERQALRPHALGRFRDLVVATAQHPAMLYYLDNWLSTRDDFVLPPSRGGRKLGLNENYARELMELHTLGVDGGYTQQDVIEVARCFTGWTIDRPQEGGGFLFRPVTHDRGEKRVLGTVIPAGGGQDDGLAVIDLLVRHPSTARFISTKLVRRFVSDEPPPALVERAARTFRSTGGDIRAVLVTIFSAPEFISEEAQHAKVKTPLEVVASAARVLGVRLESPEEATQGRAAVMGGGAVLARQVAALGEPLYEAQAPTGHPDVAEAWVSASALLSRMNFALALAHNRLPGARVELAPFLEGVDRRQPAQVLDRLFAVVLRGQVSPDTRRVLGAQLENPEIVRATADDRGPRNTDVEKLTALVLGSPEFQRR
jgi:uncharacterized protein (DUF1800 family)